MRSGPELNKKSKMILAKKGKLKKTTYSDNLSKLRKSIKSKAKGMHHEAVVDLLQSTHLQVGSPRKDVSFAETSNTRYIKLSDNDILKSGYDQKNDMLRTMNPKSSKLLNRPPWDNTKKIVITPTSSKSPYLERFQRTQ